MRRSFCWVLVFFYVFSGMLQSVSGVGIFDQPTAVKAASRTVNDGVVTVTSAALVLNYAFDELSGTSVADSSGNGHDATLEGDALWLEDKGIALDGNDDYVRMPDGVLAGLEDITIVTDVYIDDTSSNPYWLYTFGSVENPHTSSEATYLGLLNDGINRFRETLTVTRWSGEQNTIKSHAVTTGGWKKIVFTLEGDTATLYEDGTVVATNNSVTLNPADIEATTANYIGKPAYPADNYFTGKVKGFAVYDGSLNAEEVEGLSLVGDAYDNLNLGDISEVTEDLSLPANGGNDTEISWVSDNERYLSSEGIVTRPTADEGDQTISLTATIRCHGVTESKSFEVTLLAMEAPMSADLVISYQFDEGSGKTVADASGNGHDGTLEGDVLWLESGGIKLDGEDDYVDLPDGVLSGLEDITIVIDAYIDEDSSKPYWLYTFGSVENPQSTTEATYLGLLEDSSSRFRGTVTVTRWSGEQNTIKADVVDRGIWRKFVYTLEGDTATLYEDGVVVAVNDSVTLNPMDVEVTTANYIGKPAYPADSYFMGKVTGFAVYDGALSAEEIETLSAAEAASAVNKDYDDLDLGDISGITEDIDLPEVGTYGSTISWSSDNEAYITGSGQVTQPEYGVGDQEVRLSATIEKGDYSRVKIFDALVLEDINDHQKLETAAESLTIRDAGAILGNITLTEEMDEDITVIWSANPTGIISTEAVPASENEDYAPIPAGIVNRGDTDQTVILTATLSLNDDTLTKEIEVTVKAAPEDVSEEDFTGYLFAYFSGASRADAEQIYFGTSTDGLQWEDLNENDPVLTSDVGDKGVRDPFILRSPEGDKFYMIATDLRIANGAGWWAAQIAGSQSIVVWESTDLVNWSDERLVEVARDDAGCTWAPEAIYDEKTGEYLVFWASRIAEDSYAKQRMYVAKTRDFYTFTEPEVFLERDDDVIDATIIEDEGIYYRYSKDEVNKNIIVDYSDQLLGKNYEIQQAETVESQSGVEGPAIFKFSNQEKWCLLLDQYGGVGYYPLITENIASGDFEVLDSSDYNLPTDPRHGTVIPVTESEYEALQAKWNSGVQSPEEEEQEAPILSYNFDENGDDSSIEDSSGNGYIGGLYGNATYVSDEEKNSQVLYLDGEAGSYAAFPEGFFDGRDTVSIAMDIKAKTVSGNFFTLAIGKNNTKYMFLRTRNNQTRNAITVNSYSNEEDASASTEAIEDLWMNVTLVMTPTSMAIYRDGLLIAENTSLTIAMSDLGSNLLAYLGKSFYSGDVYFEGYFDNVQVYNRALTAKEIADANGVDLVAVKDVTAEGYHIITTAIEAESKKIVLYVSESNSTAKNLTMVPLTFELEEGYSLQQENGSVLDLTSPVTVSIAEEGGSLEDWTVTAVWCQNSILSGEYADPDIDVFGDTYYIYPTTDGFTGWSGTEFHVFSSKDLVDWTDEGVILDVASDDVPWAVGSAWAPSIEEKNGVYYFYFCAKRSDGVSCIGVATANSPTGPFTAMEQPLITPELSAAEGVSIGQSIDPSIYTEEDGSAYMLFGNGGAVIVELGEDMTSIKSGTMANLIGATDIREAITVTKRNGIYHFTWSCDDTGSTNYHINYGTSNSLYGPIEYKKTILAKDTERDILGTGHHSILHIPGTDDYYIAYHRFYTPLGQYTSGLGYHRETCLDKLTFDADGYMEVVTPTLEGIESPVTVDVEWLSKVFTLTTDGQLDRKGGLSATVSIAPTEGLIYEGSEVVVFQLMKGKTPISIIAVESDITEAEEITAHFNVDPVERAYTVKVFVLDDFSNDTTAPIHLAAPISLN